MTTMADNLRWQLNILLLSGIFIAYTLRVNISVAVGVICEEYGWTVSQKGTLLSCFYWGYTAGQIPFSLMGQLYGGKWIFGLSVLLPSVLTLFVPLAASTSFEAVVILRVFIGLFAAGMFPALYAFFRNWIPNDERTLTISFIYSGMYLGEIVAFPVCGVLVGATIDPFGGWESCFYLFGIIGVVWFPFWCLLAFESPLVHPRISPGELRRINQGKRMVTIAELDKMIAEEVARRTARREEAARQELSQPQAKLTNVTTTYGVSQFGPTADETASAKLRDALEVAAAEQARQAAMDAEDHKTKGTTAAKDEEKGGEEEEKHIDPSLLGALIATVRKMSATSADEAAVPILHDGTSASDVVLDLSRADVESPLTAIRPAALTVNSATAADVTTTHINSGSIVDDVAAVRRASNASANSGGSVQEPKVASLTADNLAQHEKMSPKNNAVTTNQEREEDVVSFLSDDDHAVEIAERTPWLAFFTTPAVWNLYFASFTTDWIGFILLAEMPTFLVKMLGFSEEDSGILSTPPYCAMFVSVLLSGYVFEHLETHYGWRTATVRMVAQCLAVGGSSVCLLIVVYCGDVNTSYAFLIVAMVFYGSLNSGVGCGYTDISPNFSFSMNTIGNTMSSAGGMATPLIVSAFTTAYPGMEGWRASFLLTAALSVLSLLIWYCFSKSSVIEVLNTPTPKKRHREGRKEGREKAQQRRQSKTEERVRRANERRCSRNGGSQVGSPFGSQVGSRVGSPFASPVGSRAGSVADESTACDAV